MGNNRDIIYLFGAHNWQWVARRPEHMADELARKGNRVLFIETPFDFDYHNINFRKLFSKTNREIVAERFSKGRLVRINDRLWVYKTPFALPRHRSFIRMISVFLMKGAFRRIMKRLGFRAPVLLLGDYRGADFIGSFGESLVCLDSVDEETEFAASVGEKEYIRGKVAELSKNADVLLTTSRKLYETKKPLNGNTFLIPNAVDYSWYTAAAAGEVPAELRSLTGPVLGYAGYIEKWLDMELLQYIAGRNPSWQLVLVGPSRIDTAGLRAYSNVLLIERKEYGVIPQYIRCFDACLIPFRINALTDAVNPLKVYEYLALGKPVVTTRFAEMEHFRDVVYMADSKEDFAGILERITAKGHTDDTDAVKKRKDFARRNTWADRTDEIIRIFDKCVADAAGTKY